MAQLNKAFQAEECPGVIYCISMQWFREWEAFVKGKDNGECSAGLSLPPASTGGPPAPGLGSLSRPPHPGPGYPGPQGQAFLLWRDRRRLARPFPPILSRWRLDKAALPSGRPFPLGVPLP